VKARAGELRVKSILAGQFADVPRTRLPDRVTLLEEDQIQAYFASGYLYATPARSRPLL
jgi:photosynthetic reaction center H subunit